MKKSAHGFTLVELLVVIAIISILSVIGFGIFGGAQGGARDGRRRVEIDQLAKNIEAVRNPANGDYLYDSTRGAADYPTGLSDPLSGNLYCYEVSTTTSTPPGNPANFSTACPSSWPVIGGNPSFIVGTELGNNNDLTETGVKGFTVCAGMERSSNPFCKSNILR